MCCGAGGWKQEQEWPGGKDKQYTRFVLYKENMDTHAAISTVSKIMHCNNGSFGYAGTPEGGMCGVCFRTLSCNRDILSLQQIATVSAGTLGFRLFGVWFRC